MTVTHLKLKNVVKNQKTFQAQLQKLARSETDNWEEIENLARRMKGCTQRIEHLCQQHNMSLSATSLPSRRAYAWMKFLGEPRTIHWQIQMTQLSRNLALQIISQQRIPLKDVWVELTYFSGLYKFKPEAQIMKITLSQGFIQADEEIITSIMTDIFVSREGKNLQKVKSFSFSPEFQQVILELDLLTDLGDEKSQGKIYDLDKLYQKINREFFEEELEKPRLTWHKHISKRTYGFYEPSRDRVSINPILDQHKVPQKVVEFILYHELLHKVQEDKWVNGRNIVHPPEFKDKERLFPNYDEIQRWLTKFAMGKDLMNY